MTSPAGWDLFSVALIGPIPRDDGIRAVNNRTGAIKLGFMLPMRFPTLILGKMAAQYLLWKSLIYLEQLGGLEPPTS